MITMSFELHPQLQKDCIPLGAFPLCRLLLMNDAHYPWFILVPQRENLREIHELTESDLFLYMHESALLARTLQAVFKPDKLNIAALGNVVPQLHVHHIARYVTDPAWPAPVWGRLPAQPYTEAQLGALRGRMLQALEGTVFLPE
jgi:diadenosine tetraphosphate (Ap4A) HIT family hydrolase